MKTVLSLFALFALAACADAQVAIVARPYRGMTYAVPATMLKATTTYEEVPATAVVEHRGFRGRRTRITYVAAPAAQQAAPAALPKK